MTQQKPKLKSLASITKTKKLKGKIINKIKNKKK